MTDPDILAAFLPVAETFEALGIPYRIGGSVATSAYGVPRSTLDIDLVADLEARHADALFAALRDRYYVDAGMIRDAQRLRSSFNLIHFPTMLKIDVFQVEDRPFAREAFQRFRLDRLAETEDARTFPVTSPEDMVLLKLEWFRKGGEVSERQWRDVLGVLAVQSDALDRPYMERWAADLGLFDLLELAWKSAPRV